MRSGVPFGRYSLVRRLARGGMAEIFLALQEGPEGFSRRLVIKRILPHLAADPSFLRMFMDEARIVAMLSHPHIVHLYDFGQVDGAYYLAMEYVDGIDLKMLGDRAGPVRPEHAAKIMSYVCEGLSHAHDLSVDGRRLGLVHRDVTPSNILISFDGSVKVADFGIAKAYSGDEKTRAGVVKGKFAYLSPEQARGMSLDHRSDQFNIGILLYELLTGTNLFPHDSFQRAMRAIVGGGIDPPEMIQADVPLHLSRIVMKALEPDRERRYPDTLALRAALESFLREYPDPSDAVLIGKYVRELFPEHGPSAVATGPLPQGTAPMARPQTRPAAASQDSPYEALAGLPPLLLAKTRKERPLSSSDGEAPAVAPFGTAPASVGEGVDLHDAPTDLHAELLDEGDLVPDDTTDAAVTTLVTTGGTHIERASIYESAWERGRKRRRRRSITIGLAVALLAAGLTASGLIWMGGAPAEPGPEPPSTPARVGLPPPPRPAQVRLASRPSGALITIDGNQSSLTTPAILDVESGSDHTIRLALAGHEDAERHVVAPPGGAVEVEMILVPNTVAQTPAGPSPAFLRIETRPEGARVEIDGTPEEGRTPLEIEDMEPGPHVLRVVAEGHEPLERRVELDPGERESLELRLRRLRRGGTAGGNGGGSPEPAGFGTLTINTIPWSKVYLGGRLLGMTPLANVRVPAGRHVLRLVNPERGERTTVVVIVADQNKRVQLSL